MRWWTVFLGDALFPNEFILLQLAINPHSIFMTLNLIDLFFNKPFPSPAALLDAVRNPTPLSVLQRFMETQNPTEVTDLVDTLIDEVRFCAFYWCVLELCFIFLLIVGDPVEFPFLYSTKRPCYSCVNCFVFHFCFSFFFSFRWTGKSTILPCTEKNGVDSSGTTFSWNFSVIFCIMKFVCAGWEQFVGICWQ